MIASAGGGKEPGIATVVFLIVAFLFGALLADLIWNAFPRLARLLDHPRRRAVPWTGPEVVLAFLLTAVFWPSLVHAVLTALKVAPTDSAILQLWSTVLSLPFQLVTLVLLLRTCSGTLPYQLGLTTHRLGWNALAGIMGFLLLTPVVYAVHEAATYLLGGAEDHLLTKLIRDDPSTLSRVLVVLSATVAAPVLEEVLFRGLFQPWLAERPWGGLAAVTAAVATAVLVGGTREPAWFTLLMAPGAMLVGRDYRRPYDRHAAQAIYGTALWFAAMHSSVWPSPIPLFVLGLGLGWLAMRTQSLVGPIVLHATFNAVACSMLLAK